MGKRSPIVHIEWRSKNVTKLKDFYRTVFRWKFDESMPGYLLGDTGTKDLGVGFMQIDNPSMQPGVVGFISADDLGAAESAIREAGGQVHASAQPVPGWGRFSLFTDPDGNPLGLWQSETAVKKENKRAKKAEAKREKAVAQAAGAAEDKAAQKALKAVQKSEKKAQRKAEKRAAKAAQKAAKKAAKQSKKASGADGATPAKAKKKKKKDVAVLEAAR